MGLNTSALNTVVNVFQLEERDWPQIEKLAQIQKFKSGAVLTDFGMLYCFAFAHATLANISGIYKIKSGSLSAYVTDGESETMRTTGVYEAPMWMGNICAVW